MDEPTPPNPLSTPNQPIPGENSAAPDPSPRGGIGPDQWVLREKFTLTVLALALIAAGLLPLLPRPFDAEAVPDALETVSASRLPDKGLEIPVDFQDLTATQKVLAAWMMGSLAACFGLLVGGLVSPQIQILLRGTGLGMRPAPAVSLLDLLVLVCVCYSLRLWTMWLAVHVTPDDWWQPTQGWWLHNGGEGLAAILAAHTVTLASAAAIGIGLARRRGGPAGAEGLWPLWRGPQGTSKGLARDLALGAGVWLLAAGLLWAANSANYRFLEWIGVRPEVHPVLRDLAGESRPGVLAVIFLCVTLGAALNEELLFRGILYNALGRQWGRPAGAVLAAILFAAVHPAKVNYLSLFLMGLILTWLYERTGRLAAPIAFHALNNAVSLIAAMALA